MGFCRNLAALNPNVRLTLFLSAVGGLADSLWSGTVLAAYLYEIDGDRNARTALALDERVSTCARVERVSACVERASV